MDDNPFLAPQSAGDGPRKPSTKVRHLFFFVNFTAAGLLLISCVQTIILRETPAAFFAGVIGFPLILLYAISEGYAWFRHRNSLLRKLAYANLACAAILTFALMANIGEFFVANEPAPWETVAIVVFVLVVLVAYLVTCAIFRLR